jgi:hypothetical protein
MRNGLTNLRRSTLRMLTSIALRGRGHAEGETETSSWR